MRETLFPSMEDLETWLSGLLPNTRRCYRRRWRQFHAFIQMPLESATRHDLLAWHEQMVAEQRSPSDIGQALAAICGYYQASPGRAPLDPTVGIPRPQRNGKYPNAHHLSKQEVRVLLKAIPLDSEKGLRDYSLLLTLIATARRVSEVRLLQWGDVQQGQESIVWNLRKYGDLETVEIPTRVWQSVLDYLRAVRILDFMADAFYVFTPLCENAVRLPTVNAATWDAFSPLSDREIARIIQRYAQQAGLDPAQVTPRTLRYTGALLRHEAGADVDAISILLGLTRATARTLVSKVGGRCDSSWGRVETFLNIGSHAST